MKKLIPYIAFGSDCEEALNFYKDVFGGEIKNLMRYSDGPKEYQSEENLNRIMHSEFHADGFTLMAADEMRPKESWAGTRVSLSIDFDDPEEQNKVCEKLSECGNGTMPLQDTFWGARFAILSDKFGISWMLNHDKQ